MFLSIFLTAYFENVYRTFWLHIYKFWPNSKLYLFAVIEVIKLLAGKLPNKDFLTKQTTKDYA